MLHFLEKTFLRFEIHPFALLPKNYRWPFCNVYKDIMKVLFYRFKYSCDDLRDLVPFLHLKKREKHSWRSITFSKAVGWTPANLVKIALLHGYFSRLWIVQMVPNRDAKPLSYIQIFKISQFTYRPSEHSFRICKDDYLITLGLGRMCL